MRSNIVILLFCFLLLQSQSAFSQQGEVVTGGDISGISGSVSFTIGQIDYISFGNTMNISEGLQQVYDKLIDIVDDKISITIWPNPVMNQLHIQVMDPVGSGIMFQLFTIDGMLLESSITSGNQIVIGMKKYAAAMYILRVTHVKKTVSFKTIKIN